MLDVDAKIKELLERHPDPRNGINGKMEFDQRMFLLMCPPIWGVVADNKDPECLGRIRVSYESMIPGSVSPWLPIVGQYKSKEAGFWALPEIGTQAVVVFTAKDRSKGYVIGFIYDKKHRPPKISSDKPTDCKLFQTRTQRIEIIDKGDAEEIRIESAKGKMRAVISKNGGIQLVNEIGDINIKCRNFKMESEDEIHFKTKSFKMETEDNLKIKAKGAFGIQSDKEIKAKGKNIKMSGSKGVCAEGKQIAVQDDKVVGFDTHIMVVPAGTSTANVPLPHPFIGKMNGDLSSDVKIANKGCAVKGSKAKHNDSMHMQLPGTIKFQNNPKCEGEVTGGTSSKVKIDGKEAAVIGSQVTTCNDMGMQNNSTIVAVGASIPMPTIINPLNTEEYKRERDEQEKKEPAFQNVKWGKTSTEEGEEVELSAGVKDIADGNMVTLQVFPEGKGPENGVAYAKFPLTVKNGAVSAKWKWNADSRSMPPETDPKFIFTAHSAWCNFEKSSNSLEVKLKRPEITKVEWQDADGNTTSKGIVGEVLKMHAETKNMEGGVTFNVFDSSTKRQVASIGADIKGDAADAEWRVIDSRMPENTKPLKYTIEATANRCKAVESGECQIKNPKVLSMEWDKKAIYYGDKATLKIKTFELSDESPTCKLQLWEKDYTTEDDFILEQDITINSDEVEQEIEFVFDVEKLKDENELELEVYGKLFYKDKLISSEMAFILVKLGGRLL